MTRLGTYAQLSCLGAQVGRLALHHINTKKHIREDKMGRKKTIEDYRGLSSNRVTWVGEMPKTTHDKTLWCCSKGHEWAATYHNVQRGQGCPYCAGNVRKTEKDYHNIAKSRNLQWIGSKLPKNNHTKTSWKCLKCNLEWETKYINVCQSISCPDCAIKRIAQKRRHKESDYYALAEKTNVKWLGITLPKDSKEKTLWKCNKCQNEWMGRYNDVQQGYGCPECAITVNGKLASVPQLKLAERIGGIINYKVGTKYIDIAFPDQKIAIEYDSWFWHSDRQDIDKQRAIQLIDQGWKVLSVKSNLKVPSKEKIKQSLYFLSPDVPYRELILSDWGNGITHRKVYNE